MNSQQAKQVLLLYRPGSDDARDPEVAAALEQIQWDPELRNWFEEHCAFQVAMKRKFRQIPAPVRLRERLLAERRITRPAVWGRGPVWMAAAAVLVILAVLAVFWSRPRTPDRFADFRGRMVRTALRQYSMDIVTNDMQQVRQFMARRGAPSDYVLPRGLQGLSLTGGGLLTWRNTPVAMVCFDRGDGRMLYLFVMDRSAVKDAPPVTPGVVTANKLVTASWTRGDRTYLLAGPEEAGFASKYL
jgi:hypothetical protein